MGARCAMAGQHWPARIKRAAEGPGRPLCPWPAGGLGPAMCPRLAGPSGRRRASGRQKRLLRAWLHAAGGGASGTGAPSFIKSCTRAVIFDVCTDLSHESCKSAAFSPILPFFGQSSAKFLHVCRIGFPP